MEGFVLEMITFCINLFSWVCAIAAIIWLFICLVANPINRIRMIKERSERFEKRILQNKKWLFRIQVLLQMTLFMLAILWCIMEDIPAMFIMVILVLVITIVNFIKIKKDHGIK